MPTAGRTKSAAGKKAAGSAASGRKRGGRSASASAPRKSPAVRAALWVAATLLFLFVLLLLAALLVFSPYRRLGVPLLKGRHYRTLNRLSSGIAAHTFRRRPVAEARLRLAPDEVNDLLELARRSAEFGRGMPPVWSFTVSYRPDGAFAFTVPLDAAPGWLFGGKIYADGVFRLEKQNGKLLMEFPELRLGRLGVPVPGGGMFITDKSGGDILAKAFPPEFDAAIKEFYPERDGTLVLVYRPAELLPLLLKFTQ